MINADEIAGILKQQIAQFKTDIQEDEVGTVIAVGANLARVEMQVAFPTLARRLPGLRLAVPPEQLSFKDANIYGMKELPVSW